MSWFRKLVSGKNDLPHETGELSAAGHAATGGTPLVAESHNKVPRAERVSLFPDHQISFFAKVAGFEKPLKLRNISLSGIAFDNAQELNYQIGDTVALRAAIGGKSFETKARVVRAFEEGIGALFLSTPFELSAALTRYLQVEIAAVRIVAISRSLLKPVPRGIPFWYEGERKTGLYFVQDDGKIVNFTVSVFGSTVEFNAHGILTFGQLLNAPGRGPYEAGSSVKYESHWPEDMVALCQRFIRSIPALDPAIRGQISDVIAKIPTSAEG